MDWEKNELTKEENPEFSISVSTLSGFLPCSSEYESTACHKILASFFALANRALGVVLPNRGTIRAAKRQREAAAITNFKDFDMATNFQT